MSFESLQRDRMRRRIAIMTSNEIRARIDWAAGYLRSISPKVSRYKELKMEYDLLRERLKDLTQPPLA